METKLKPCPFCGGKPAVQEKYGYFNISCPDFDCPASNNAWFKSLEESVKAWNTRAERTCRIIKTWSDSDYVDGWRYRCSECSCFIPVNERDFETGDVISAANYCPNCGAKVVM